MDRAQEASTSRGPSRGSNWYRSVARPLLFSIPPEAAHRLAQRLLGLPLPWERLGGVDRDPVLRRHARRDPAREPRRPGRRVRQERATRGRARAARVRLRGVRDVHAPSPPWERQAEDRPVPGPGRRWSTPWGCRTRVRRPPPEPSAGRRREARGWRASPTRTCPTCSRPTHSLEPFVDAVELNASCPNVAWGRDRDNETHLANLVRELGTRRTRPLFVKLPPFRTEVEREVVLALAAIAKQEGADALTVLEHPPGPGPAPVRRAWRALRPRPARGDVGVRSSGPRGDGYGDADQRERRDPHAGGRVRGDRGGGDHRAGLHGARLREVRGWLGSSRRGSRRRSGAAGSDSPR